LLITIAHFIDGILGDEHYFRDAVVFFYLANELLSIIENVGRMGVPMPDILRNAVAIYQSRSAMNNGEKGKSEQDDVETAKENQQQKTEPNEFNQEDTRELLHMLAIVPEAAPKVTKDHITVPDTADMQQQNTRPKETSRRPL